MAEQEITYIPYGQDEISQQDLMTNLANGLPDFVKSYKWLQKPGITEKFLNAYKDIINHGITGASNSSGLWEITHNGDKIDTSTMSPIDKQIYEHAAYYIQQKMAQMTPRKKEEETAKKDLKDFNFINDFNTSILNEYGGQQALFRDPETGWNSLDPRGDNGLRGIDKRRDKVKTILQNYLRDYKDGQYNFEGTPFKDDADVKAKVQKAIDALDTIDNTTDDVEAFNALGLPYRTYFSNGSNESTNKINPATGTPFTYNEWNQYQQKTKEAKAKQEAELAKQKLAQQKANQYQRFRFHTGVGVAPEHLAKYSDVIGQLNGYNTGAQLTQEQKNELVGAFQYAAKNNQLQNLSKEELARFGPGYANNPTRLKKLDKLEGFYWDSVGNRVIQPFREVNTAQSFQDLVNQNSPKTKEQEYLNSKIPGVTNAEWKELSAIGLDIASIVDPEAITGSGLSLAAAGLRHSAKNDSNPNWDLGDYFWQGVDYLTGALGGIQVLGDLTLGAKTMATASKAVPILRKIARAGAWNDLFGQIPDLAEATRKITSGEELTVKDWRAIGQGIRGLVSHGRLNRGNRTERRVLEKSGNSVTPENISSVRGKVKNLSQQVGFTRTKPTNTSEVSTIKATVNGKETDIEISSGTKSKIQEKVKKAGNNTEARNKAVKEVLTEEGKIKESDKIEVQAPNIRDGKYVPNWAGTSRNLFETTSQNKAKGEDVFESYVSGHRGYWDRYKYGSNRELRGIYNRLNINGPVQQAKQENPDVTKKTEAPKTEAPKVETPTSTPKKWAEIEKGPSKWNRSAEAKEYEDILRGKFGSNAIQGGVHKVGDLTIDVDIPRPGATNGFAEVSFKDGSKQTIRFDTQKQLQEQVAKIIKERRIQTDSSGKKTKVDIKEMSKILKSLKSKGFLKQGGKVNPSLDEVIKDFINNNNI